MGPDVYAGDVSGDYHIEQCRVWGNTEDYAETEHARREARRQHQLHYDAADRLTTLAIEQDDPRARSFMERLARMKRPTPLPD